jgi:SAM-dependent methyltransferase
MPVPDVKARRMMITFKSVFDDNGFEGWERFPCLIEQIITSAPQINRVCEVGAGANPCLSPEFIASHGLLYRAVDESSKETAKAGRDDSGVFDICKEGSPLPGGPYDLICSRMTAEHFRDAKNAHDNIYRSLTPGGVVVHSFATMYSLPYLLNLILPGRVTSSLLRRFHPRDDEDRHGKFRAYYSRCRGPTKRQLEFLSQRGFQILEYRGFFGHFYYQDKLSLLNKLERAKARLLTRRPVAALTSYATVIMMKIADSKLDCYS